MGNIFGSSKEIKNKQKAKLIFSNFYLFDKKDLNRKKRNNVSSKEIDAAISKSKKYIESYANLEHIVPHGVKIKVLKITYNKSTRECVAHIIFNIKKSISITEYEYQKYIEDRSNGPFESVWDDAPANISTPTIQY